MTFRPAFRNRIVVLHVCRLGRQKLQVFYGVIQRVFVPVMNDLRALKLPSDVLLHHISRPGHASSIYVDVMAAKPWGICCDFTFIGRLFSKSDSPSTMLHLGLKAKFHKIVSDISATHPKLFADLLARFFKNHVMPAQECLRDFHARNIAQNNGAWKKTAALT